MKAVVLEGKEIRVKDVPKPNPSDDEALIRVHKAGICNTDLELTRGYMDYDGILGHEFVGEVESAKDKAWIGKRVVGEINIACGKCAACTRGYPTQCEPRAVLGIRAVHGAFA